jgi:hypothetical protein
MANPFDQFDQQANPFDQFDGKTPAGRPPPQRKQYGNPVLDYMAGDNHKRDQRTYESDVRREANKDNPKPILQPGRDLAAPFQALAQGARDYYEANSRPSTDPLRDIKGAGQAVGLLAQAVAAPISAVINQGVNPVARVGERLGFQDERENAGLLNTAISGARTGFRAPVVKPIPPGKAALIENVQRFDRAGVTPNLATTAPGRGKTAITNTVAENPIAGAPTRNRLRTQVDQAEAAAAGIAGRYGTVRGPQIVGENVQAGVDRFANSRAVPGNPKAPASATSFAAKAETLYDNAFSEIRAAQTAQIEQRADLRRLNLRDVPPSPVTAPQTEATLNIIANRAGGEIGNIISDPKLASIAGAVRADRGVSTFEDLRALRTWVRTAQRDPNLRQGIDDASLQSLERALTADIMTNAESLAGPQAAARLRRADQYYAAGSERIKRALQPFDDAKSGESAYQRIVQAAGSGASADAQKLVSLKRSLNSEEWGDVAANVIADLGKPSAGVAGMGETFSASSFLTNYEKLSPRAREVLFGSVGGGGPAASSLKAELDNLAFVVGQLKQVQKGANTSNTFVSAQSVGTVGGLVTNTPATVAALGSMAGAGEFLTNPAFVRWLARTPKNAGQMPQHMSALDALVTQNPRLAPYRERLIEQLGPYGGLQQGAQQPQPAQASQQPTYRP